MGQRAVARRRAAISAQDVADSSEGFRPGRSPHEAGRAGRSPGRTEGLGWSVEAEGRGDCESRDRPHVRARRRQRVNEGRLRRLRGQWRRAGVRDGGGLQHPDTGVGPGGGIAPGLAKVMRQQVVEAGGAQAVQPRLQGRRVRTRCAADVVLGGERDADARRGRAVRPKRCARLGWRRPPAQTAGMAFRHPRARQGAAGGHGTGAVLGVTHDGAPSRRGYGGSKRQTARQRRPRPTKARWRWGRVNRPLPRQDHYGRRCQK